jgi:hypothetical protein
MPRPITLAGCALLVFTITAEMVMYFHRASDRAENSKETSSCRAAILRTAPAAQPEAVQRAHPPNGNPPGVLGRAAFDPEAELAAAMSEPDPQARKSRIQAALRTWSESAPDAAFQWACRQNANWREESVLAALSGAASHPERAIELAHMWTRENNGLSLERGAKIVRAWGTDSHYSLALALCRTEGKEAQENWTPLLFSIWASNKPEEALGALKEITDESLRANAQNAIIRAWPPSQFPALADFALSLPTGESRSNALTLAMERWGLQDPTALGAWLNERPDSDEFDAGMAFLATKTDGLNRPPSVALTWAEAIKNPSLRFSCVTHVVEEWRAIDPAAARSYVSQAAGLSPEERNQLLEKASETSKPAPELQ